ncbi:pimeloyl-ACP methyl ester carboxylesterase [Acinetobacter calcoaceticus]|uniref:Pimeloyl-ACP methyl ester carboxylesterase n=1 Tax=Acinetobacter calcoaceticus TaxID=471 RepID=A0A4R1XM65_ACICA|nr:pimeloyl-ACP methyl ester carboxylesterase [Acinetobacter calcoaceticus]
MTAIYPHRLLHSIARTVLSLSLIGSVLGITNNAIAAPVVEHLDYQKFLREERAWAGLSSKVLRVGDLVWSYSEGGDPDKPTILLIHGLGSSRDTWNTIARALTPYYHVVIPDLPTNGETKTPANFDLSVPNVTEQLRRFIEASQIQNKLNVAGHSLGGTIAMFYASQYPFDTQSLMLISSGGLFKNNNTNYLKNPAYLKQLLVAQSGDLEFVKKKVMHQQPFVPSIITKEQEKILIAQSDFTAKIINQISDLNKLYTVESYAKMAKGIEAPTLIMWGMQDQIVNVEVSQELKSMIKRAETPVLLNQVGHIPIIEAPERVIQSYIPFLQRSIQQQNPFAQQNLSKDLSKPIQSGGQRP